MASTSPPVVVGYDGSEGSEGALRVALHEAKHSPSFSLRRIAGVVAIASAVALAPAAAGGYAVASATHAGAAVSTSTPRCATSGLVVWLDTKGNHAAGSTYYKLEFTNLSEHPCTLVGFPGVSAVDLGRHRLGSPASRNEHRTPHVVRLASGATATSILQITQAANFPRSACRQRTAAGLRVYPPNQTASGIAPFPFRACSRTGPVYLHVEAAA